MRLVRNNAEDPRVAGDLELLSQAFGPETGEGTGAEAAAPAIDEPAASDPVAKVEPAAAASDDPFVRRFVQVAVHIKRYAPFYAGAFLWLLTMALVPPVDLDSSSRFAASDQNLAGAPAASSVAVDDAGLVVAEEPGGATFSEGPSSSSRFDLSGPLTESATFEPFSPSSGPAFEDTPIKFDDGGLDADEDEGPEPLTIVASGYASQTAGTPLEQPPPQNGLPVGATGNQDTKRSFVKLAGEATVLRLKLVSDTSTAGNVNAAAASIKICPITKPDWQPARGQTLAAAPPYNNDSCQSGTARAGDVWEFDLEIFGATPSSLPGFALTNGKTGATGNTFQVVFQAAAAPPSSSG